MAVHPELARVIVKDAAPDHGGKAAAMPGSKDKSAMRRQPALWTMFILVSWWPSSPLLRRAGNQCAIRGDSALQSCPQPNGGKNAHAEAIYDVFIFHECKNMILNYDIF